MKILGIDYTIVYSYNDYDNTNSLLSLLENGKEKFYIESSKLDENKPSNMLNKEVLKQKEDFLFYNITLTKNDNGNFIVKKIIQDI